MRTNETLLVIVLAIVAGFSTVRITTVSFPVATEVSSNQEGVGGTVIFEETLEQQQQQGSVPAVVIPNDDDDGDDNREIDAFAVADETTPVTDGGPKRLNHLELQPEPPQQEPPPRPKKFYAVHIGPSKTGTSAIQKDLRSNPFTVNTLSKDNVVYVGKRAGYGWGDDYKTTEIRTINGNSLTPADERNLHFEGVNCMLEQLKVYYGSHNNSTEDTSVIDERLATDEDTRAVLRNRFRNECWANLTIRTHHGRQTYDARYLLDSSLIDSQESHSYRGTNFDEMGKRFVCFDILGYEKLVVVGAYRRYADWIVSAYTQSVKTPCTRPNLEGNKLAHTCPNFKNYLKRAVTGKGDAIYNTLYYTNLHTSLPQIKKGGPSKLQVKVLNFFQLPEPTLDELIHNTNTNNNNNTNHTGYDSITTELYCDALGEELTPHTCNHARTLAREQAIAKQESLSSSLSSSSSLVTNKGTTSDSVYQSIVATAHMLGYIVPTEEQIESRKQHCRATVKSEWCEDDGSCLSTKGQKRDGSKREAHRDACNALIKNRKKHYDAFLKAHGTTPTVVGSTSSNITNWKELSDFHSTVHGLAWTTALPVTCPNQELLDTLLRNSLELEERVVPAFYNTPLGKEAHQKIFRDVWLDQQKLFCWVDLHRLFRNATSWDEILHDRMINYNWTVEYEPE